MSSSSLFLIFLLSVSLISVVSSQEGPTASSSTHMVVASDKGKEQKGDCAGTDNDVICGKCTKVTYTWKDPATKARLLVEGAITGAVEFHIKCSTCATDYQLADNVKNVVIAYTDVAKNSITKANVADHCVEKPAANNTTNGTNSTNKTNGTTGNLNQMNEKKDAKNFQLTRMLLISGISLIAVLF